MIDNLNAIFPLFPLCIAISPVFFISSVEAAPAAEQPAIDKSDSIEEALAQLTVDEELNTKALSSMTSIGSDTKAGGGNEASTKTALVPPSSADIENFYKEVQRYEKIINGLTTKTLNGTTPLETKWKELQESLKKDAAKRTVGVSKLFPEKNRTMLAVPFDHARVLLPTDTDNYINAAHVQVSSFCCLWLHSGSASFMHNFRHILLIFDSMLKVCFGYHMGEF